MAEAPPVAERSGFAWSKPDAVAPTREEYRTFPRSIAPTLIGVGAGLAAIGALGGWIRAVQVKSEAVGPESAGTLWGFSEPSGRAVAIVAAVVVFIAAVSFFTNFLPRFALEASALALFGALLARVISLNSRSAEIADAAKQNPNFLSYNAGFGWGAWLMLLGAVLLFLGLFVGGLRELDLKRGKPE